MSRCRTEPGEWHLSAHSSPVPELSGCHTESPTPMHWLHPHPELPSGVPVTTQPLEVGKPQVPSGESWSQPHSHRGSRPSLPIAGDDGPSSVSKGTPKRTRLGVGAPSLLVTDRQGVGGAPVNLARQPEGVCGGWGECLVFTISSEPLFPRALSPTMSECFQNS